MGSGWRLVLTGMSTLAVTAGSFGACPAHAAPTSQAATVTGHMFGAGGEAVQAGSVVELVAWPRNEDLARIPDGGRVSTRVVARAATGADGRFTLTFFQTESLRKFAASAGVGNFSLESSAGGLPYSYSLSRRIIPAGSPMAVAPDSAGADFSDVNLRPLPGSAAARSNTADSTSRGSEKVGQVPCGTVKIATLGPRWVQVGRAYTTTKTSASMTYSSGASSTLGVGASWNKGASFSQEGTNSVGSSSSVGMPTVKGYATRAWRSQFVYTKYGSTCAGLGYYTKIWVKATSFAGGSSYTTLKRPAATFCVRQAKGSSFIKDQSTSSTFKLGAGLTGDIGITLSSQTGYSASTSVRFNFSATRRLCGTRDYPGATPGQLRAKE
jgi:hypothetical protein